VVTISPIKATRTAFAKRPTGLTIHKINPGDACRIARTERNGQHLDDQQARNNRRKDIVQFGFWRDLDQQHAEQGRRERRGSPPRINLVPMARGELPPATAVICGSEVRPSRTVHDVRLVRRKHPGTIVEARSNYCRLLQQVHIPGDAMEGTTADQSVWLGEDRSPPAERHFEAAAAGIRR
jgi:hypothetical protein